MKPFLIPALLCLLLLSACHSLPKHVKYIPEDATIVVGVNTGSIGKKVAWSAITGSKILDELKAGTPGGKGQEAMKDIEESGIDFNNTIYFYAKPDKRFEKDARMSLVAPLEDTKKWEAYVKKVFPAASIHQVKGRSEALLDDKAYAAWNGEVLMISNSASISTYDTVVQNGTGAAVAGMDTAMDAAPPAEGTMTVTITHKVDTAMTAAEMDAAFSRDEAHSIANNKRFKSLEAEGHDITAFVAYGGLMDSYASQAAGMGMMGSMMSGTMWKNAAVASGIDFEKGKISGLVHYYPSDSLQEIAKLYGEENIDKDILNRVPAENLNLVAGYHLSPKATKMMLDKLNLSGMANLVLMQKGLSVDEILNAFTGDMVVALNNMGMKQPAPAADSAAMGGMSATPDMDYVFAMKLGKKESFNKLFALAMQEGGLQQVAPNTYAIPGTTNMSLVVGDQYFAVSNKPASAQAFLQKSSGKLPDAVAGEVTGHPIGAFFDLKLMMNGLNGMAGAGQDAAMLEQMRNTFSTATISGGEYKSNASEYHMTVNMVNKDENSLLQILQMAQRMAQAKKGAGTASL